MTDETERSIVQATTGRFADASVDYWTEPYLEEVYRVRKAWHLAYIDAAGNRAECTVSRKGLEQLLPKKQRALAKMDPEDSDTLAFEFAVRDLQWRLDVVRIAEEGEVQ
ncbi:MAG: hypothetical protein QGH25_00455 [Candidatus Latescibacteria bacterium]|jgi:hypothetical protein|nr:hypothetical protein [Candidatus Latescibacterota bacterium]